MSIPYVVPGSAAGALGGLAVAARAGALAAALPRPRWRDRLEQHLLLLRRDGERAPPQRKTIGDFVGLCLPVDFPDLPMALDTAQVDAFCNEPGYSGFGNHGSVQDYFHDISARRLRYRTLVAPRYTAQHERAHYVDPGVAFGQRARELVAEALEHHREQGMDFSSLSTDAQRGVYAINLLYAGAPGEWGKGLWPHASRLQPALELAHRRFAADYQISALADGPTLGVYCHENGHMLCDFPDLYPYTETRQKVGVGHYCLMCMGAVADAHNPTLVGAYLRFRAGWAEATPLVEGDNPLPASGSEVLIHRRSATEYFLFEYRRNSGRDARLDSAGLAVWHIDELGSNTHPEAAPDGHRHPECRLLQADGRDDLEQAVGTGDPGDLFGPGPAPVFVEGTLRAAAWWDGTPAGMQIESVQDAGDSLRLKVRLG